MAPGAVVDDRVIARPRRAGEDVPHARAVRRAVEPVEVRDASGGGDHDVGVVLADGLGLDVAVETNIDPEPLQLLFPPIDQPDEIAPPARFGGEEAPAPRVVPTPPRARTSWPRSAHTRAASRPAGAAAGNQHATLRHGRLDLVGQLALVAGGGVVEAGRAQLAHAMRRAHAGAHPRLVAAGELRDQLRVRDLGPGHRDHIEQPLADRVPCGGELGDAGGVEDREAHRLPEGAGPGEKRRHR